ncbi:unnamed protein product [Malus baccata var. baccata]
MASDKGEAVLKLEGRAFGSTHGSVVNHVVIQNDASNAPNTVKLNGSNYPLWSKVLEMHIAGRGKKRFVTRSIKEPNEDSVEYDAWETENAIVKGWLINSMDPTIMAGLDDVFDKVRSDILRTHPLPSVEEVFSIVRREAQRHAIMMGVSAARNQGGTLPVPMMSRPHSSGRP